MVPCRAPYGARGLKSHEVADADADADGRAPYGARGLKSLHGLLQSSGYVAPRMGRVD